MAGKEASRVLISGKIVRFVGLLKVFSLEKLDQLRSIIESLC